MSDWIAELKRKVAAVSPGWVRVNAHINPPVFTTEHENGVVIAEYDVMLLADAQADCSLRNNAARLIAIVAAAKALLADLDTAEVEGELVDALRAALEGKCE